MNGPPRHRPPPTRAAAVALVRSAAETIESALAPTPEYHRSDLPDRTVIHYRLGKRNLRISIEIGKTFVERYDAEHVICDQVMPGCRTKDGRSLDLIGLVRSAMAWLQRGAGEGRREND